MKTSCEKTNDHELIEKCNQFFANSSESINQLQQKIEETREVFEQAKCCFKFHQLCTPKEFCDIWTEFIFDFSTAWQNELRRIKTAVTIEYSQ